MRNRNNPDSLKQMIILVCAALLSLTVACMHKSVKRTAATTRQDDSSYMDLVPGTRLRILVPVLKSGDSKIALAPLHNDGDTVVLSAANLLGYEVSYYAIEKRRSGAVHLRFDLAEITKDGKTAADQTAPVLPFPLPSKAQHVRLIYLVRNSQSDHNMAITASKNFETLNLFTNRLKGNPDLCQSDSEVFCTWVPSGVAVRPE